MKYRSFPVVSLFVTLPAWAFDGGVLAPEAGFGSQVEYASAASSMGMAGGFPLTEEAAMMSKQLSTLDDAGLGIFSNSQTQPELTQQAKLIKMFSGFSIEVSPYPSGLQRVSVKSSHEPTANHTEIPEKPLSEYQKLLFQFIRHVAFHEMTILFDEKQAAFFLSFTLASPHKIKVPSRVDMEHFPEGPLTGFSSFHKTALTDINSAVNCYNNASPILSSFKITCSDGSSLSWSSEANLYVYEAGAPAPVPPENPFSLLQFGFAEGWYLSDEYLLLAVNGKPVNISMIGDVGIDDEPMDTHGEGNEDKQKAADQAYTGDDKENGESTKGPKKPKKRRGKSSSGDDDPNKNKPTDYGRQPPKPGVIAERKTLAQLKEENLGDSSQKRVNNLKRKLQDANSSVERWKHTLSTRWGRNKAQLESQHRIAAQNSLREAEKRRENLKHALDQERERLETIRKETDESKPEDIMRRALAKGKGAAMLEYNQLNAERKQLMLKLRHPSANKHSLRASINDIEDQMRALFFSYKDYKAKEKKLSSKHSSLLSSRTGNSGSYVLSSQLEMEQGFHDSDDSGIDSDVTESGDEPEDNTITYAEYLQQQAGEHTEGVGGDNPLYDEEAIEPPPVLEEPTTPPAAEENSEELDFGIEHFPDLNLPVETNPQPTWVRRPMVIQN